MAQTLDSALCWAVAPEIVLPEVERTGGGRRRRSEVEHQEETGGGQEARTRRAADIKGTRGARGRQVGKQAGRRNSQPPEKSKQA